MRILSCRTIIVNISYEHKIRDRGRLTCMDTESHCESCLFFSFLKVAILMKEKGKNQLDIHFFNGSFFSSCKNANINTSSPLRLYNNNANAFIYHVTLKGLPEDPTTLWLGKTVLPHFVDEKN